jgi:hypothetical protein
MPCDRPMPRPRCPTKCLNVTLSEIHSELENSDGLLHALIALPVGKKLRFSLDIRLRGHQSWCAHSNTKGRKVCACQKSNPSRLVHMQSTQYIERHFRESMKATVECRPSSSPSYYSRHVSKSRNEHVDRTWKPKFVDNTYWVTENMELNVQIASLETRL